MNQCFVFQEIKQIDLLARSPVHGNTFYDGDDDAMAPIVLDEVNVFTFAHSRMKKLMNCCTSKVSDEREAQDEHVGFVCRSVILISRVRMNSSDC